MIKNISLLIISIIIYTSFGINNLAFILFSLFTTFAAARCFKSKWKKPIFITAVTLNAAVLVFVKFLPYFGPKAFPEIEDLSLFAALGVSYYTLQVISYLVDVYKGKYQAEKNLFYYSLFILYIPHLFIGPVSRYDDMKRELTAHRRLTVDNIYSGSLRIVWGLLKKLIIAGRVSIIIGTLTSDTGAYSGFYALLAMVLYSVQLYSDFSGGIDIVLGVSKIFGLNLVENFDSPYYSQTIREFWRRWHMSLSSWLRDYIYIPLGGSRRGKIRKVINLLITFLVSGLWHGVNYILWGAAHGILVFCSDVMKTKFKWLNRGITFILVSILWSFFIWSDLWTAVKMTGTIFTNFNIAAVARNILNLGLSLPDWVVLAVFTVLLFIFDGNRIRLTDKIKSLSPVTKTVLICTAGILVLVFGIYGVGFNVSKFIYSDF